MKWIFKTIQPLVFFVLIIWIFGCKNAEQNKAVPSVKEVAAKNSVITNSNSEIVEINCDTIYKNKDISLKFVPIITENDDVRLNDYLFYVLKTVNGKTNEIYRDTIQTTILEVLFTDFTGDAIPDILIQNQSDVRSNFTYNLFVVNDAVTSVKKIKGFQEIKNPNYLPQYNLIDNMVMSGRNYTSFYKIVNDSVKDYNKVIYDGENDDGTYTYDNDYKKAIQEILKLENKLTNK